MKHTVMIVDDNTYIVEGLMAILKRRDYQVISAKEGGECLKLLKTITPDVILLDLTMEPMDGWEILEEIKGNLNTRHIPVVIFSGREISADEKREYSTYVEDYMFKPVNPKNLLETIERAVERQHTPAFDPDKAREAGVDQQSIDEYTALSSSIEADRRLLQTLVNNYASDPDQSHQVEVARAIKTMGANISELEERLRGMQQSIEKAL